ncbi:putative bifunctional lysylphosphatidylglycerol flippase/synthetase [Sutcliffiella halmapala]|uniref:lysylphosphatidylglycerol synthase domain-containing protein n=1 Tax=Sutcliffiella halmapala TaxID=79882 RepID=UPI00099504A3|nr:lysylphosphatidylglycerol synthase domain-containing protein [Sutcliffiella halmapala]
MQLLKNTYLLKVLKVVFPLTILIVIYIEAKKQMQSINLTLVFQKIQEIGLFSFIWILFLGIIAVATMILYDVFLAKYLGMRLSKKQIILQGFSANSFANFLGFGGFAGVGLRTIFYRKQTNSMPLLLKWVTIILPYMLIGLSIFAWIVLIFEWRSPILLKSYPILKLPLFIMCGYGIFIVLAGYFTKSLKNKSQLSLIGISLLEWVFAAILFFQISLSLDVDIPIKSVFLLFFMAAIAGVLSTVPGGVGAFDFVIVVGLSSYAVSEEKAIALLFIYRLVYYAVPFLLSNVIVGHFFYREKIWKNFMPNREAFSTISHRILSIWVVVVGALLLLFPVVPAFVQRVKLADRFLSMEMMQISQQFSIAIGITLMVLARAIEDKVNRAYSFTFYILIIGTIVSFSKGFHIWEVAILLVALVLLYGSKDNFYRSESQYTIAKILIDGFILFSISMLYVFVGSLQISYLQKIVPKRLQDLFSLHPQQLMHDVLIGVIIAIFLIYIGLYFKRKSRATTLFLSATLIERASNQPLFPTKPLYVYRTEKTSVYYQKWMDSLIVVKVNDYNTNTLKIYKEFETEIDKYGYSLVIPQLTEKEAVQLKENGFQIYNIGQELFAFSAKVPQIVTKFSLKWLVRYTKKVVR